MNQSMTSRITLNFMTSLGYDPQNERRVLLTFIHSNFLSLQVEIDRLQELANLAKGQRCAAHAAHILQTSEIEDGVEHLSLDNRVSEIDELRCRPSLYF